MVMGLAAATTAVVEVIPIVIHTLQGGARIRCPTLPAKNVERKNKCLNFPSKAFGLLLDVLF